MFSNLKIDDVGEPWATVRREVPLQRLVALGDSCPSCHSGSVSLIDTPAGWKLWMCPGCGKIGSIVDAVIALADGVETTGSAVRWLIERGWLRTAVYDWQRATD